MQNTERERERNTKIIRDVLRTRCVAHLWTQICRSANISAVDGREERTITHTNIIKKHLPRFILNSEKQSCHLTRKGCDLDVTTSGR